MVGVEHFSNAGIKGYLTNVDRDIVEVAGGVR
jgi:hypothetical protein